jgi:hypothetical protein
VLNSSQQRKQRGGRGRHFWMAPNGRCPLVAVPRSLCIGSNRPARMINAMKLAGFVATASALTAKGAGARWRMRHCRRRDKGARG